MLPSLSVPDKAGIALAAVPIVLVITWLFLSSATGAKLTTGIVKLAGVLSFAPLLSIAVKLKLAVPINAGLGSNSSLFAYNKGIT